MCPIEFVCVIDSSGAWLKWRVKEQAIENGDPGPDDGLPWQEHRFSSVDELEEFLEALVWAAQATLDSLYEPGSPAPCGFSGSHEFGSDLDESEDDSQDPRFADYVRLREDVFRYTIAQGAKGGSVEVSIGNPLCARVEGRFLRIDSLDDAVEFFESVAGEIRKARQVMPVIKGNGTPGR